MLLKDLELRQTCRWAPEQYDVYSTEWGSFKLVGYIRLRHGNFRVDFPYCGGETVYSHSFGGDIGEFSTQKQRRKYLNIAKKNIIKALERNVVEHKQINFAIPISVPKEKRIDIFNEFEKEFYELQEKYNNLDN